jgi:aryl-alcohol dehydrogenase-like predicted oxidoreductase
MFVVSLFPVSSSKERMTKRKLGKSDLEVAPLMFGGNVFGWTVDEAASFRLLDQFVDAGFNFIDTADVYSKWAPGNSGGESETIIGRWLKRSGHRNKVLIATKVGMELAPHRKGLSAAYISQAVEASLHRLQIDHIDLYQSHKDDPDTDLEETLSEYDRLVKAGKVRYIGASNYSRERLAEALHVSERCGFPRYQSLQPQYNLYDRHPFETDLEKICEQMELGVIPYYSLASGFLTGKYATKEEAESAKRAKALGKYFDHRGHNILAALQAVAAEHNSTSARVALAWLMARPSITAPIASATSPQQLHDILGAVNLQLSDHDLQKLNHASA